MTETYRALAAAIAADDVDALTRVASVAPKPFWVAFGTRVLDQVLLCDASRCLESVFCLLRRHGADTTSTVVLDKHMTCSWAMRFRLFDLDDDRERYLDSLILCAEQTTIYSNKARLLHLCWYFPEKARVFHWWLKRYPETVAASYRRNCFFRQNDLTWFENALYICMPLYRVRVATNAVVAAHLLVCAFRRFDAAARTLPGNRVVHRQNFFRDSI